MNITFLSHLFDSDIELLNQVITTYNMIKTAYNQPLFGTSIHMGSLYLLGISGTLAPLIGTLIGESINSHRGHN